MSVDSHPDCACPICAAKTRLKKSGAAEHFRNARKEMLLGVKSLIEACIDRLDEQNQKESQPKAHKVEIS